MEGSRKGSLLRVVVGRLARVALDVLRLAVQRARLERAAVRGCQLCRVWATAAANKLLGPLVVGSLELSEVAGLKRGPSLG